MSGGVLFNTMIAGRAASFNFCDYSEVLGLWVRSGNHPRSQAFAVSAGRTARCPQQPCPVFLPGATVAARGIQAPVRRTLGHGAKHPMPQLSAKRLVLSAKRLALRATLRVAHACKDCATGLTQVVKRSLTPEDAAALTQGAYARMRLYDQPWHQNVGLFEFELQALAAYFPAPPATLAVIGCGGGREVVALLAQGYTVEAVDPVPELVAAACRRVGAAATVQVGGFADVGQRALLLGPVDGVVTGWGAWGHLLLPDQRAMALRALAQLCPTGPILLSWPNERTPGLRNGATTAKQVQAGLATQRHWRDTLVLQTNGVASTQLGREDVARDCAAAGCTLAAYGGQSSGYPHAVVRRALA